MRTKRRHEGWLLVDHTAPGLPAAPGYAARVFESATVTCSHCQRVVVLNPDRSRARGYCPKCDHYVCDGCEAVRVASGGDCFPFIKRLDLAQERASRGLPIGDLTP